MQSQEAGQIVQPDWNLQYAELAGVVVEWRPRHGFMLHYRSSGCHLRSSGQRSVKTVGLAYVGSNPTPATIKLAGQTRSRGPGLMR